MNTDEFQPRLGGIKPKLVGGTLFVPLPDELQRTIEGGCQCNHCKLHPRKTPKWDTLAIDATAKGHTWTPRKGRPRIEDKGKSFEATKPWIALGMSRRTWYSRRAEFRSVTPRQRRKEKEQGK